MQKYKRHIKDIIITKKVVVIVEKYELTDYQWSLIKPLIPSKTSTCGRARRDPRQLFNAIFWVLITGSPWCALPKHYGPWHTAYNNLLK